MLAGWARQQQSRFLRVEATIGPRAALVRRLAGFAGQYPWEWEPAEAEAFISHLRSGARPVAVSTARWYEGALRLFCEYVTDPRYEWAEECDERFGRRPVQVFHEWNSVAHVSEYEGAARLSATGPSHRRASVRPSARVRPPLRQAWRC